MRIERLGWIGAKGAAAHCAGGELAAAWSPDFAENGRPGLGFRRGSAWELEGTAAKVIADSVRRYDERNRAFRSGAWVPSSGELERRRGDARERKTGPAKLLTTTRSSGAA